MDRDGIVGVRLPFIGLPSLPDITTFDYRAFFRRLADLDWHVHPHVEGEDLPKILPTLEASGVKIVIDHLGRPEPKAGINSEGFKAMLRSIDKGRTWVKVSGGYRLGPKSRSATHANSSASPGPSVWCGRATARSSATKTNSRTSPPSTGSPNACRTRWRVRKFWARPR